MKQPASPIFDFLQRHRYQLLFYAVVLTAIFFRFYHLSSLPPGLHPDEAANGLDIFRILEHHDIRPLYNTNGPRESLFFFLQAIFVAAYGNTILALRLAPALIGTLAVIVTYFWVRRLWTERVALISSFLFAITPWAVTITRDGFRASMVPLMIPLTMLLYTLGYQTRRTKWWLLAGISLGAGMYTYLSFRLFPFALVIGLAGLWLWHREQLKSLYRPIALSIVAFLVVLSPLIAYGIKHPGDVGGRAAGTSFLNRGLNHGKPLQTLGDNIVKTALMFNVHGDENYRHNLGGQPELNFFVGVMFILGILICLTNLRRPKYLILLAILAVMLGAEALTAEGIPHALRAVGAMPEVFIISALGINYMLERWYSTFPINSAARSTGLAAILLLLGLSLYQGYNQYFIAWAESPQTYEAYSEDAVSIAKFINNDTFSGDKLLVYDGYSDKTVQYLTHHHSSYRLISPQDIASIPTGQSQQFIMGQNQLDDALRQLRERFPKGRLIRHYSDFNNVELFEVYEVKP